MFLWNSLSIMIRILEPFLVRMILTHVLKNYSLKSSQYTCHLAGQEKLENLRRPAHHFITLVDWNQNDPNALTWKQQIAWFCKWHDII